MTTKPTLILVPGAWHRAEIWTQVASLLEKQHYKCVSLDLPSTAGDSTKGLYDDIHAVRNAILAETTLGRDVVLIVHSYGAAVGQSALRGLTRRYPCDLLSTSDRPTGHVIGLAMMGCGFVQTGVTVLDAMGGSPPPVWRFDESGFAQLQMDPRELFYHDVEEAEAEYWVGRLTRQSQRVLREDREYAYAGWLDVPAWYLMAGEDRMLGVGVQRVWVEGAREVGADMTGGGDGGFYLGGGVGVCWMIWFEEFVLRWEDWRDFDDGTVEISPPFVTGCISIVESVESSTDNTDENANISDRVVPAVTSIYIITPKYISSKATQKDRRQKSASLNFPTRT
ncbi:hypothetical protein EYC80_001886 [Monilinia laxa]|uniref:AB hydrolase-1 domain-containing protein n=1 Tax=Monilinia laxa TaxID=61186 RepID=A0A5N6K6G7_MONLA|nr:hypothetical protein EYC80_001886 [Monilinia laxa]